MVANATCIHLKHFWSGCQYRELIHLMNHESTHNYSISTIIQTRLNTSSYLRDLSLGVCSLLMVTYTNSKLHSTIQFTLATLNPIKSLVHAPLSQFRALMNVPAVGIITRSVSVAADAAVLFFTLSTTWTILRQNRNVGSQNSLLSSLTRNGKWPNSL